MSEFVENLSEDVIGQDEETPERGRPGTDTSEEPQPQPGPHPGAGKGPEPADDQPEDEPQQGLGEPDSH
ncbi:MAG: hypothetical protein QOE53_1634 [Pseudonocardiales bacterium]|jgi:hypothetical protein|nr:hypothetical protein [Pseudonocardiales bacterium]